MQPEGQQFKAIPCNTQHAFAATRYALDKGMPAAILQPEGNKFVATRDCRKRKAMRSYYHPSAVTKRANETAQIQEGEKHEETRAGEGGDPLQL